jgi:hypothetical protein
LFMEILGMFCSQSTWVLLVFCLRAAYVSRMAFGWSLPAASPLTRARYFVRKLI